MAWELLSTLPKDGRRVVFTRSVDAEGATVEVVQSDALVQVYGWLGTDGKLITEQVLAGDPGDDFEPTHWYPDPAYDKVPS